MIFFMVSILCAAVVSAQTGCNSTEISSCSKCGTGCLDCSDRSWTQLPCATSYPKGLTKLRLTGNNFTLIPNEAFSGLSDLQELTMQFCNIKSIALTAFSGLTALQQLILSDNALTIVLNNSFIDLTQLQILDLSNQNSSLTLNENAFSGIPSTTKLYLYGDANLTISSSAFANISKFTCGNPTVQLTCESDTCEMKCGEESSCSVLGFLTPTSNLNCNSGPKNCSNNVENECNFIQSNDELNCDNLSLSQFPCTLSTTIAWLDLGSNLISFIPFNVFVAVGYSNLRVLSLNSNPISTLQTGAFTGLYALQQLSLASLNNVAINSGAFIGLSSTTQIDLYGTYITTISSEAFPAQIQTFTCGAGGNIEVCQANECLLSCGSSSICEINAIITTTSNYICQETCNKTAATNCKTLGNELNCEENELKSIPCSIPQGITILDLSNNKITTLQSNVFNLPGYSQLTQLNLNSNPITLISNSSFLGLTSLQQLLLSDLNNVTIDSNAFVGLSASVRTQINLFNSFVTTISSNAFPLGMGYFTCGSGTPDSCSTTACQSSCGANSICIVNDVITPQTTFKCQT